MQQAKEKYSCLYLFTIHDYPRTQLLFISAKYGNNDELINGTYSNVDGLNVSSIFVATTFELRRSSSPRICSR